jgi:hypothetical protein
MIIYYEIKLLIFVLGIYFSFVEFLGVNILVWAVMSGVLVPVTAFVLYTLFCTSKQKQLGCGIQIYKNNHSTIASLMGLCIISFGTMVMVFICATDIYSSSISIISLLITIFGVIALLTPIIFPKDYSSRRGFSVTYFDESGIHNVDFGGRENFISWEECEDIGWFTLDMIFKKVTYMYFSKEKFPNEYINGTEKAEFNSQHIWTPQSDGLLEDVMQYLDEDIIP